MLLAFMKARMNFIQIRTQFGKDEERLQTLATETVSVLRSKLSTYKLSLAEGTDLTQLFADQNILPEQTADELQSLVSLASGGENQQPASALPQTQTGKGQSFKHFEHYLIQQEWQTIQDMRVSIDNKLYLMGARLVDLECLKADEHTFASLVAILIAAQPGCDAACVQEAGGPVALGMVVKLKNHFESLKAGSSNPQEPLLMEFPASPSEWRTMRPDTYARVYPNAPPVPCQLDPTVVSALKARVPCRKSKGSAQASAKSGARLALQDSPQQDLLENLVRLLSPSKAEPDNSISALFPATAGYQGSGHLPATKLALRDGKALPPLRSALSSSSDGSSRPMGGGSSEAAAGAGVGSLKPEGAGAAAGVEEAGVESLWAVSPGAPASESAVALAPPGAPASESVLALESMDSPSLAAAAVHGAAGAVPAMLADGGGVVGEQPVASTKNLSPNELAGRLVLQINSLKRGATTGETAPASKKKKAKVS